MCIYTLLVCLCLCISLQQSFKEASCVLRPLRGQNLSIGVHAELTDQCASTQQDMAEPR